MPNKNKIGVLGERIATRYFEARGYKILEKNYWKPQGEIDLIVQKEGVIHFIEVKSVSWEFGKKNFYKAIRPEENLHKNKLKRFFRAVQIYLIEHSVLEKTLWQMDALFVFIDSKEKRSAVEHYEHISIE